MAGDRPARVVVGDGLRIVLGSASVAAGHESGWVTIDHLTGEPAYLQPARILREMITSGQVAPRQPMPSIKTLTQQYGVAEGAAEKALGVLKDEGLLVTVPGRGIYVTDR
jgi:GntR family transcriptional regulator